MDATDSARDRCWKNSGIGSSEFCIVGVSMDQLQDLFRGEFIRKFIDAVPGNAADHDAQSRVPGGLDSRVDMDIPAVQQDDAVGTGDSGDYSGLKWFISVFPC